MLTISVIIPTYNRQSVVGNAIKSILDQTYPATEIILVDDASTDSTVRYVAECFPNITIIELETNRGASAARNAGIKASNGDLIAFLDSDDFWDRKYLSSQVSYFDQGSNIGAVFSGHTKRFNNGKTMILKLKWPLQNIAFHLMLKDNFIHTMSLIVVKRDVFHQVGFLKEELLICHDRDFYYRILSTFKIEYNPENLVVKTYNDDQVTGNIKVWYNESLTLLNVFLKDKANSDLIENLNLYKYKLHRMFYPKITGKQMPLLKIKSLIACSWHRMFISGKEASSVNSFLKK